MIAENFKLKVFKCRSVKTPSKSWEAAGWDFYVPEDLSIYDFIGSYKTYLDDNVIYDKECVYYAPIIFYMKSGDENLKIQPALIWDKIADTWKFYVVDYDRSLVVGLDDEDHRVIKFLNNAVVSRIELMPQGSVNIPSGIHVNLPENIFLKAENKSGIGSKRRLMFLASVVDYDYEGEIHLNLINASNLNVMINAGEKIIQMLPMYQPIMKEAEEYSSLEELYKGKKSERGAGGFGSSGV